MGLLFAQAAGQQIDFQPGGLEMGLLAIGGILSLIAMVLGIMVVVKMCQNGQQGLGIAAGVLMFCTGIGHIIALIFGWMKVKEWNIKNLMLGYTISLVLGTILFGAGYGVMISKMVKSIQNADPGGGGVSIDFPDGAAADPFGQ